MGGTGGLGDVELGHIAGKQHIATDSTTTCPSPAAILGIFAAVNGVVSVLSVICGHQRVINIVTFKLCGHEDSKSWRYMWIVSVGLQLAANAAVAALIRNAAGIDTFKIWDFMLFYVARPRLSWVIVVFLSTLDVRPNWPIKPSQRDSIRMVSIRPAERSYARRREVSSANGGGDNPWRGAAMSQVITEFVLQLMACYPMGLIVYQGSQSRVYDIITFNYSIPELVRLMYAGALYYLIMGTISLIILLIPLVSFWAHPYTSKYKFYARMAMCLVLISTWLGSWLFWAGFVNFMAGAG
jgi:hypothetical protein